MYPRSWMFAGVRARVSARFASCPRLRWRNLHARGSSRRRGLIAPARTQPQMRALCVPARRPARWPSSSTGAPAAGSVPPPPPVVSRPPRTTGQQLDLQRASKTATFDGALARFQMVATGLSPLPLLVAGLLRAGKAARRRNPAGLRLWSRRPGST